MKFLFIAPRFHTNQFPIVKSLIEKGHKVEFLVQYRGKIEDYSLVEPHMMKKSLFLSFVYKILEHKYDANSLEKIKIRFYIPSAIDLFKKINEFRPDVVILRDRNFTSMFSYFICKILNIKYILIYNQSPLYISKTNQSIGFLKRNIKELARDIFFPKVRITPVYTNNIRDFKVNREKYYSKKHEYFVPFIAEVKKATMKRKYCINGKINILDVGKYRDYKNHYVLVDAISLLKSRENLKVTIVGQVANEEEQRYFDDLKKYIQSKGLSDKITLLKNIKYNKMYELYLNHDVFVLTSKREVASIAVLEAMANGLVTVSTDANGTASYIEEGKCGYLFRTMDTKDLASKIEKIISNKSNIEIMGRNAYQNIKENYSFNNYYSALGNVLKKEFGVIIQEQVD